MTADVELLPLPSPQVPFIDCDPSMTDIRRLVRWYEQGATEYARACVAHATAAKDAENERLRAEVEAWRELSDHVRVGACAAIWPDRYTDERTRDVAAALKRAERLREALRYFAEDARNAFYATGCASCDALASRLANSAAALRDHDQENKA